MRVVAWCASERDALDLLGLLNDREQLRFKTWCDEHGWDVYVHDVPGISRGHAVKQNNDAFEVVRADTWEKTSLRPFAGTSRVSFCGSWHNVA